MLPAQTLVPGAQAHALALHTSPEAQGCPQAPQFKALLVRSTQLVPQAMPEVQVQTLPLQTWPVPQAWPQEPQLALLVEVSTQLVPQVVPEVQVQTLPLQAWLVPQAWPQEPQLAVLAEVSTQVPPQSRRPEPQPAPHCPPTQACPLHECAQLPQFAESEARFTQPPLQFTRPAWQTREQDPAEQTW